MVHERMNWRGRTIEQNVHQVQCSSSVLVRLEQMGNDWKIVNLILVLLVSNVFPPPLQCRRQWLGERDFKGPRRDSTMETLLVYSTCFAAILFHYKSPSSNAMRRQERRSRRSRSNSNRGRVVGPCNCESPLRAPSLSLSSRGRLCCLLGGITSLLPRSQQRAEGKQFKC